MQNFQQIQTQAQTRRKAGQWAEALQGYRQLWYTQREHCGPWEGWGYAQCLYKLKQYTQAEAQCREALETWPDHDPLRNQLAWCLYQIHLKQENLLPEQAKAVLAEILNYSSPEYEWGPAVRAFFLVVDLLAEAGEYEQVLEVTAQLEPSKLSAEAEIFTDKRGKTRNLPSPRLKWYARQSEALLQTGAWAATEKCCRQVLEREAVSADQRFWFERRLARSLAGLSHFSEAETLYRSLLTRKQDWFLYRELAELLFAQNRLQEAISEACRAALAAGEPEKKLNLYLLLAQWLQSNQQTEQAQNHRLLVLALRQKNGWPLPEALSLAAGHPQEIPPVGKLLQQLEPFWQNALPTTERLQGSIRNLLPHGQAGFIAVGKGKSYYFLVKDFQDAPQLISPGLKVSFALTQGYDRKKQQPSLQAVQIQAHPRSTPESRQMP